jgi:mRNA-degrading endonuclease RelE of RelBE toxin-antitoxin system
MNENWTILRLEQNPFAGHLLSGALQGVRSLGFSLSGGAYRIAYFLHQDKKVCLVFMIGSHENFYEIAERRFRPL